MKKIKIKSAATMIFLVVMQIGRAQQPMLNERTDLKDQLLPLDSLVDIAIKHSPSIKFQEDLIGSAKAQIEFTKRQWSNNVIGFMNYSGGNQVIVSADPSGGTPSSSTVTSGFRVGVQVNLPLFELVGRKSQAKINQYQLNSTINKRDETEQSVRQLVIQFYYSLLYANNLLAIRNEAKQSTINQYQIAEKQFKDGIIDIAELSRLKTIQINASADYEDAKRQFSILYAQIESTIGAPVEQLIRKR